MALYCSDSWSKMSSICVSVVPNQYFSSLLLMSTDKELIQEVSKSCVGCLINSS
jgi:hypothetical protein